MDQTPKEAVVAMLARLEDDVSYEQIAYHVDVMRAIDEARLSRAEGDVYTHEEVRRRFASCLSGSGGTGRPSETSKVSADT